MQNESKNTVISTLGIFIWSLAALFFLYEFFLRTFIGSVAHQIIPDLHLNAETFAILGSAYYVAYGIMQIPVGILADKFGVKILMIFATLTCAAATFGFAKAHTFYSALISRFFMGFGSSFAFICLLVVAVTWFPRKYFGFFAGLSQFIGTMGPLLAGGPLIAFMADYHETWRTALTDISAFGVLLCLLIIIIVKNKPRDQEQPLIFLSMKTPFKIRLLRLAQNNQAWAVALYSAAVYISLALLGAIWGTEYLQSKGLSQVYAGDMISIAWLGYAIGCPLLGAFSDLSQRRKPLLISCGLLGIISTSGILYLNLTENTWIYGVLFFGLGIAASGQNIGFATISEHVDLATRATALGMNNATLTLFGAIFPPIVSYVVYLTTTPGATNLSAKSFVLGLSIMPLLNLASTLIAMIWIKETFCKPQKEAIKLTVTNNS